MNKIGKPESATKLPGTWYVWVSVQLCSDTQNMVHCGQDHQLGLKCGTTTNQDTWSNLQFVWWVGESSNSGLQPSMEGMQNTVISELHPTFPYDSKLSLKKSPKSAWACEPRTLDSGTNAATWDPGVLESSIAARPGTLIRWTTPLEKSRASKNWISLVANRHAIASSELNRIEGLKDRTLTIENTISKRNPNLKHAYTPFCQKI